MRSTSKAQKGLAGRMDRALAVLPPDTSPMEAKKALGRAYRRYALENTELFLLVFGSGDAFGKLSDQFEESESGYGPLINVVRQGVETGEFADLPPEAMALTSWAGVHGFVMLELGCLFEAKQGRNDPKLPAGLSTDDLFELHMDLIDLGLRRR